LVNAWRLLVTLLRGHDCATPGVIVYEKERTPAGVRESNHRSRAIVYVRNNHDQADLPFVFVSGHPDPAANTAADLSRRSSGFHHRYRRSRWYERTHRVCTDHAPAIRRFGGHRHGREVQNRRGTWAIHLDRGA